MLKLRGASLLFLLGIVIVSLEVARFTESGPSPIQAPPFDSAPLQAEIDSLALRLAGREASTVPPPTNCYAEALAVYWYGGVALARGEDAALVHAAVARAVASDPELSALWERAKGDLTAFQIFTYLLQAKAWHGGCP